MGTVTCPPVTSSNLLINSTGNAAGTIVAVKCTPGYKPKEGVFIFNCLSSGQWSPGLPVCIEDGDGVDAKQVMIISIAAVGSVLALCVFICACYMLICYKKRKPVDAEDGKSNGDDKSCISEPFAIRQDCVGMPAVVFTNLNSTLTGRQSQVDEEGENSQDTSQSTSKLRKENSQEKEFCY